MIFYLLLSIGLAMDAFTLAIISGMTSKGKILKMMSMIAVFFGAFQGLMPLVGYYIGKVLHDFIKFNHWISFGILLVIGVKMLWEALKKEEEVDYRVGIGKILLFSIAGSIDALAVGFSFAFIGVPIFGIALLIGIVTFVFSALGVVLGAFFHNLFGNRMEIVGGLILIVIAFKFL